MLKKILVFLMALLIFALPLSVSAEGEVQSTGHFVNISATVDGAVPTKGEFKVKVEKETFDDENDVYSDPVTVDTRILKSENKYSEKYGFTIALGERYSFSISTLEASVFTDNHVFYAVLYPDVGLVVSYENDEGSQEIELPEGQTEYNLNFANKSAPKLTEVKVKGVDGKKISKVYDGNTDATVPADCLELVGVGNGADVKLEYASAKFNSANVKDASAVVVSGFKLVGKDAAGYILVTESVQLYGEITPLKITVTANNAVMSVGNEEPALTYNVDGKLLGNDKFIGELARTSGYEIGQYVITMGTLTVSGNAGNYDIVFKEGTFTISNFSSATVSDATSKISVNGHFDASAVLSVSPISATDSTYKALLDNAAWGKMISAYNVNFSADPVDGNITVTFPVPSEYNGKEIAIYQLNKNGAVTCFKTTATAGNVMLTTDSCTQFMLVAEKNGIEEEEGEEKRSAIATVLLVLLIILGIIVGLVLLIVLLFFGMVFFNKTEELKAIIRGIRRMFRK